MNFFSDSSEWKWHFKNAIDWDAIIPLYYPSFPTEEGFNNKEDVIKFLEELITAVGDWTANKVAPRARILDEVGGGEVKDGGIIVSKPLQELYDEAKALEIFGMGAPKEYGGLETPAIAGLIGTCFLSRACIASSSQLAFFGTIIDMIYRFCPKDIQDKYIPEIIKGNISGSMCLTEPGCGSDVGAIRTSATLQKDGTYLLNGTKCFITNGGGGLAFTLARIKGSPEGLNGISLFFVEEKITDPKTKQKKRNFVVAKNEHKLGMSGSHTCEIVYENSVARLIGEENKGMDLMFHLMNESRVGVGLQAIGGIEASLSYAREYATNRKQFGKPIVDLPLFKRNLKDFETEMDAYRALVADSCVYYDIYQRLDLKKRRTNDLDENEIKLYRNAKKWTRRRTPILKYYGAETFTLLSQRGIQMLGGYGFMMEYDAQRLHRDSFAPLLYEGTSQIQALMAMKDLIKFIFTKPTKFLKDFISAHPIGSVISDNNEYQKNFKALQYEFKKNLAFLIVSCLKPEERVGKNPIQELSKLFNTKYWQDASRYENLMYHAETIIQVLSYIETMRVLTRHATKDSSRADLLYRYELLIRPRIKAIFTDWKQFKVSNYR